MLYSIDLIAQRDAEEKTKHSVIKWWQANYMDPAREAEEARLREEEEKRLEEERAKAEEEDEALKLAAEINARLAAEAAADEAAKQAEIAQAMQMAMSAECAAEEDDDDFNATTGSRSGSYGKNVTLDDEGKNQVGDILKEKSSALDDLIASVMNN